MPEATQLIVENAADAAEQKYGLQRQCQPIEVIVGIQVADGGQPFMRVREDRTPDAQCHHADQADDARCRQR